MVENIMDKQCNRCLVPVNGGKCEREVVLHHPIKIPLSGPALTATVTAVVVIRATSYSRTS